MVDETLNLNQGWIRVGMALGCNRARKQANSRTIHIQGKKHVCC